MIHISFNVMMDQSNEEQFEAELYRKYDVRAQPLRVMTGPYFQSFCEMTENFSHYA